MITGSIENTAKYLAKKASSAKKTCPERVASSARLKGVSGSEAQRNQKSQALNNQLFKIINDAFERKIKAHQEPILKKKDIRECIRQIIPNIKISVKQGIYPGSRGYMHPLLDKTKQKVVGFCLVTKGNVKKGVNDDNLRHEMCHILDYMTKPKTLARNNTDFLIGKLKNYTGKIDLKHNSFYEEVLYHTRDIEDEKTLVAHLTKKTNAHFKKLKTPADEKIEILQCWRSNLKSELRAYTDEAGFSCEGKNADQWIKEEYGSLLLKPKIKLVEQLLKDEIASVRKIHAKKYGQN